MSNENISSVGYNIGSITVRKACPEDVPLLRQVLTRAFNDDPFTNWFCLQDRHRTERVARLYNVYLQRLSLPYGEVYTTQDRKGAALWSPPGKWDLGVVQQVALLPDGLRITGAKRVISRMIGISAVQKEHPKTPHWYLQVLGTEPELQGRGIGSALLEPVLRSCDQNQTPAYLESSKERNISFYENKGFKVERKIKVPFGGPDLWLMWREPAQVPSQ